MATAYNDIVKVASSETTIEDVRRAAERIVGQRVEVAEAERLVRFCLRNQLDPFEDVHFVRARSGLVPIVARSAWLRRVARDPMFQGLESGVLVTTAAATTAGQQISEMPGAFCPPGHRLVGAWARIHRADRAVATYVRVSAAEYADRAATPGSAWAQYPSTMLCKVAQVHACREAFPDLGGAYDEAEFPNAVAVHRQVDPAPASGNGAFSSTPTKNDENHFTTKESLPCSSTMTSTTQSPTKSSPEAKVNS
jgi:phage recombination protein Bet